MNKPILLPYQRDFILFLLKNEVLQFGAFTTKSGRETPYFINTGRLNSGADIAKLGSFYAHHIVNVVKNTPTVIFGPAYKGIPLAVATATALYAEHQLNLYYSFDRKEEKTHGDAGSYVGRVPQRGDTVVIVEDVVTAGTTLQSVVPRLLGIQGVSLNGVVVAVDRCERGLKGGHSAVREVEMELGISVFPLVTVHHIMGLIEEGGLESFSIPHDLLTRMRGYVAQYGSD